MTSIGAVILGSAAATAMKSVVIPVAVAALTMIVTLVFTRVSDAANRRRDRYAAAVATLVAWVELPYRIRRRTDDAPETLARLAEVGHALQEQLACHEAWISTENARVAAVYAQALRSIRPLVGTAMEEAWNSPAVTTPSGMVLGEWGPGKACAPAIAAFKTATTTRFGWSRLRPRRPRGQLRPSTSQS